MAEDGKPPARGGGRRGHPVRGNNVAGQYRALFAHGVMKRGGKGGKGKARYVKGAARALTKSRRAGGNPSHNHNTNAAKREGNPRKTSAAGMKAAHLRGSGGGSGRRVPSKAERDATRESRVAAGRDAAALGVARAAQRYNAGSSAANEARRGIALSSSSSARSRADGLRATRAAARMTQSKKRQDKLNERRDRITTARQLANGNPRAQKFENMKERLGRDGAIKATRNRAERVAAGRAKYAEFAARRDASYGGGLFSGSGGSGGGRRIPSKAERDVTRAARVTESKMALARFGQTKRGKKIARTISKIDENNHALHRELPFSTMSHSSHRRVKSLTAKNERLMADAGLNGRQTEALLRRLAGRR